MLIYKFHAITKEYLGNMEATADPLETEIKGEFVPLIPANATVKEPPQKEGFAAVFVGGVWELKEDNRGREYWLPGDEYGTPARVMKELGPLPEGATFEAPEKTLEQLKAEKHNAAGAAFAAKRDAIRFVELSDGNTYGFDCANEDITNFMANWKAAELDGQTEHKVWLDETTKGMVVMQPADFKTVFDIANKSQKEAYVWYGEIAARIAVATSKEELDAIEL
ncbi:MAG: hypothetical protein IKW41_06300 [Phascolarctobacterium sp.]|nr:hypothetical protein [Phascolarctobacterium sp.]